jgi:hypothetical protein
LLIPPGKRRQQRPPDDIWRSVAVPCTCTLCGFNGYLLLETNISYSTSDISVQSRRSLLSLESTMACMSLSLHWLLRTHGIVAACNSRSLSTASELMYS